MTTIVNISPEVNEPKEAFMRRCTSDGNSVTECEVAYYPESLKTKLFKAIEKQRGKHERGEEVRMRSAIRDAFMPVVEQVASEGAHMDIIEQADWKPVYTAISMLWSSVALRFASEEQQRIRSLKGIRRWGVLKEVDAELLESFVLESVLDHAEDGWTARAKSITNTAKRQVSETLTASIEAGEGAEASARRLNRKVNEVSIRRARVIVRTEIVGAQNFGARQGAVASGVDVWKEWLSTRDGRVRTFSDGYYSHASADGERRELNESFIRSGQSMNYPGDVHGSPGNVCNCRCAETHIPKT